MKVTEDTEQNDFSVLSVCSVFKTIRIGWLYPCPSVKSVVK
jgi:hypothetical protein